MPSKIHSKRKFGSETYTMEMVSPQEAREVYGLSNACYTFHYNNSSVAESGRMFEKCNIPTRTIAGVLHPLFNMTGLIQILPNGYVLTPSGKCRDRKNVYVVVFCRLGGQNNPDNLKKLANTLAIPYSGGYGYKTVREAIDHARRHMINHFYAIRGVHGEGMATDMSLAHFTLKPYVRKELEAAVAQVDAALATSPVALDKYKAAAQRLQMDCDALTAIHNASKPFATQVPALVPCTNTLLSKSASAAVDKASVAILSKESMSGDANAVLPNATYEDLKKLAFDIYTSECQCIIDEADSQIDAIKHRRDSKLHQESVKKDEVVNLVCDRSRTVAARLRSLNDAYWGYVIEIHGKRLDVYA